MFEKKGLTGAVPRRAATGAGGVVEGGAVGSSRGDGLSSPGGMGGAELSTDGVVVVAGGERTAEGGCTRAAVRERDMDVAGMREVRSALVFARDLSGRSGISRRARSGELLRISSGVYLEAKALEGLERWQQAEFIYCARLHAVCAKRGSAVLCGQSAAFVHGLPMVEMGEVACYSRSAHGQSVMRLPAVRIPGSIVVKGLAVRPSRSVHGGRIAAAAGLRVSDPLETALECAFGEHEETAFVQTCSALHLFSGFSRFNADSRNGAEMLRQHLLEGMAVLPLVRKIRANARWTLENADPGCESPGECRVLYALKRAGLEGLLTQVEVPTPGGVFFIDIAIPGLGIAIEFDGRVKYGASVREVHESPEAESRRQRLLELAGWTVIRVRWGDLKRIDEIIVRVRLAIAARRR